MEQKKQLLLLCISLPLERVLVSQAGSCLTFAFQTLPRFTFPWERAAIVCAHPKEADKQ